MLIDSTIQSEVRSVAAGSFSSPGKLCASSELLTIPIRLKPIQKAGSVLPGANVKKIAKEAPDDPLYMGRESVDAPARRSKTDNVDVRLIQKVITLIEENLENPDFKIRDLSKSFPLEERQLRNKVKSITGLSPKRFQQEIALRKAKNMLENEQCQSVKAAAYSVGMFHVTRFSKLFKSRFGKHPASYCHARNSTSIR